MKNAIKAAGLQGYLINLMVMDYGSTTPGNCTIVNGRCDMGQSAIAAAESLHNFHGIPYNQIELTPMGQSPIQDGARCRSGAGRGLSPTLQAHSPDATAPSSRHPSASPSSLAPCLHPDIARSRCTHPDATAAHKTT
jgi:hypothetical protein